MGLIEQEIKEIRQLIKQFDAGKVSVEFVNTKVNLYSQTEKRMKMALQAFTIGAKYGKNYDKRLLEANLIGNEKYLDLIQDMPIEEQMIFCPLKKHEITRATCLDFSGEAKNYEKCKGCEIGIANKQMLCGPKKELAK